MLTKEMDREVSEIRKGDAVTRGHIDIKMLDLVDNSPAHNGSIPDY